MKIAILSFYSGHIERGVETWTHQLANRLSENHEVWVIQNGLAPSSTKYKVYSTKMKVDWNIPDYGGTVLRRLFLDYWSILIAVSTLKSIVFLWRENFDIVIPTSGGWQPAFIRIITWLRRKKMVIVGHSGIGWDDRNNLWCFPDSFVALSSYAKKWAERANPFIRVDHIPDGVDLKKFDARGERIDLGLRRPIVLCVSALIPTKRVELVIKAVAKLKNVSLCVVGKGDLREELNKLGRSLMGNRFALFEFSFDEMPKVYRSCNVLVSASLPFYSFEMVLLEAMASGIPVVANNDPIRKEIVGNAGFLADPTNIDLFANAIQVALYKNWADKPRKQAEKFDWEKVTKMYDSLFKKLIEHKR